VNKMVACLMTSGSSTGSSSLCETADPYNAVKPIQLINITAQTYVLLQGKNYRLRQWFSTCAVWPPRGPH
jgi:hypothetical protein